MAPLEAIPDSEKDWHPGSNGFILNLVTPSLYPIVYGRTMGKVSGSDTPTLLAPPAELDANPMFVSQRFQLLPSDFTVDDRGKVTLASPYINNIHPTHHEELCSIIPEILQHALPMFERVLSDLSRPLLPIRLETSGGLKYGSGDVGCIWENGIPYPNYLNENEGGPGAQDAKSKFNLPDARKQYRGDLKVMNNRISLKDRTLQVIVTMANIVLTPEKPDYPGGRWHVEGLLRSHFAREGLH